MPVREMYIETIIRNGDCKIIATGLWCIKIRIKRNRELHIGLLGEYGDVDEIVLNKGDKLSISNEIVVEYKQNHKGN